ncbi:hypothetical protein MMC14_002326 [Varicellaria rhodocarpa]|nr:hypothetical protein [Varicellaria rhodocarpa]
MHTAYRVIPSSFSIQQSQYFTLSTDEAYLAFTTAHQIKPCSIDLPYRAKAHWIGPETSKRVVIFLHGGCYVYGANVQFEFFHTLFTTSKVSAAAVILSYTLIPEARYPTQLQQVASLLKYLLSTGKAPSDIIIGGDSAGGHLALSLISHILHPHPSAPPVKLSTPLLGLALISPWVEFGTSAPSYTRNKYKDVVTTDYLEPWSEVFLNSAPRDEYNTPLCASTEWWTKLRDVTQAALITSGAEECFADDIEAFAEKFKSALPTAEVLTFQGEAHDQPFVDLQTHAKKESESMQVLKSWLVAKLEGGM